MEKKHPNQDDVLSIRLPAALNNRLKDVARKLDLSKNDIARHAIRAAVLAIEANDYRIELPMEMSVGPMRSEPNVNFEPAGEKTNAPADGRSSPSTARPFSPGLPARKPKKPRVSQ